MNQALVKREYYVEVDDLVDELLASVRKNGWTLAKMQYEACKLEATRKAKKQSPDDGKKSDEISFRLTAEWKDFEDAVELTVKVDSETDIECAGDCRTECTRLLDALPEDRTYQNLYTGDPGAIFEEFENNN